VQKGPLKASYDAVVIGSGHNGLVAAAYLGQAGKSVLVLERNTTLGGATASERVFPDYDAWLSKYSYLVSLFPQKITDDLGLVFETRRRRTASFTPYAADDGSPRGLLLSNVDSGRSRQSMHELSGDDQEWTGFQHLMDLEAAIAQKVWPTLLEPLRSKTDFASQMSSALEIEAWISFVEEPIGRVIERCVQNDALRGLLMTDAKIGVFTHPHDESLVQNRCFLYHVIGGGDGEWRVPIGGMRSLVDSLVDSCRRSGVEFRTSAEVTGVEVGPSRHTVRFNREGTSGEVGTTNVLVNAGPKTFARIFGQPCRSHPADEGSVIKINMLLKRLPKVRALGVSSEEAFAGSFHIDEGYAAMQNSYRQALAGEIPDPAPGEIYCHTLTDPSILGADLQAQGYQTLTLFGLDMPYRLFEHEASLSGRPGPNMRRAVHRLSGARSRWAAVYRDQDATRPGKGSGPRPRQHFP
jgi:phytoene dehydrogenase-like protein